MFGSLRALRGALRGALWRSPAAPRPVIDRSAARRRLTLMGTALLVACGGGGDAGPTGTTTGSISIDGGGGTALTLVRGSTQSSTITIIRSNYTGPVTLAVSGAPSGVTVDFSPATIPAGANTSTITVTVAATATPGTYTATASASGTGISTATLPFTITIPPPTIAISAGSGAGSVTQGQSTNVPITITRGGGYTDVVTLSAGTLPTGITAAFAPASLASGVTASTLTITAATNATPGTYPVVVTAAGTGVTSQTATVNLTVTATSAPSISVTAAPAALSVQAGQNGTSTITIVRSGGFTGDVALSVAGAPTGTTAAVSPTTLTTPNTASTLTLTVGANTTPGLYNVTVTASGTGVTNATTTVALTVTAAPSIAISTAPNAVSLAQGASTTSTISLARTNFTGDVALAASNLPSGVTASFAPATLTGATLQSTLTLTAASGATLGAQTITVTASGTGVGNATATIATTVTVAQGFSLSATAASAAQGGNATSAVTITRTGGYVGAVTLSASGLPTGVTAGFAPNNTTGNSSTLTLSVGAGAATGSFPITVTGAGPGLTGTVATTLTLTVTASGGGSGNVNWTFCAADRYPTWFAVQNGTSGGWTTITPSGSTTRVYTFTVSSAGGVAYAIPRSGGGMDVTVQYGTAAEFTNSGAQECVANRARQNLTGTVAGLALGTNSATIALGNASGSASVNGPYSITNGPVGTSDLLAVRSAVNLTTFTSQPDRVVFRRNVNYTSTIPAIDFATEGVAPASATYTITNLAGESYTQMSSVFSTANGSAGSFSSVSISGAAALTVYGVPNSLLSAGDQHLVQISAVSTTGSTVNSFRSMLLYNQQIANRSVTLGAAPPALTPTSLGTAPYVRFSASGTWSSEYGDALGIGYTQTATNSNSWTITMTRGYTGAVSGWTMTLPDFSGVSGFQTSWGLAASSTNWAFTQTGIVNGFNSGTGKYDEGALVKLASRSGTISP